MTAPHNPEARISASDRGYALATSSQRSPNVAQAVLLGSTFAQLAIALAISIYLARELTPVAFGFFSLVGTIFVLARKFLDLGLGNVAAREITIHRERERPILEGMMAYRRVAGIALALGLLVFAFVQKGELERWVLMGAALVMLVTEPAALDPVFQVRQAQGAPAVLNIVGGLLVLAGSVWLKKLAAPGPDFAWLLVAREALILLFTLVLASRLLGYLPRAGFRGRALRQFVAPALIFGLASLVYTIYFNCDVFFVYAMRGKEELGAYAAAYRPINPLLLLPWLLMVPMIPVLTATAAKNRELFVRQVRRGCGLALGLGTCALAAGTMLAPELVQLLYGGKYSNGALSCVNAFRWLAIALSQVCVTTVLTAALLADRREKLLLGIGSTALLANAAFNLFALRYYNFTAAGFATAMTELLYLAGALAAFQVVTSRSAVTWKSFVYVLPALLLAGILTLLRSGPVLRVVCGVVLGALAVAAILLSPEARSFRREMAHEAPAF